MLRNSLYTILFLIVLLLTGCRTKKIITEAQPFQEPVPTWHTCLVQNARATVFTSQDKLSANITMQTVRDSFLVISVMPLLGMEMMRVEATPLEITAIDKLHGRYAKATFAELNKQLTPCLNWDILQQLCAAELPTGSEKARLVYTFDKQSIELVIDYTPRKTDIPVRVTNQPLNKYTLIDISKWL